MLEFYFAKVHISSDIAKKLEQNNYDNLKSKNKSYVSDPL